ncbi:spore coat protein B [Paenibacillus sp. UNC496MF]|uniref:hypothetical protein n=1 Tax=Paenibacillus sp. UNC496MF TaxID=1502753 RepID=UPI0008E3014D|nr:hypothetical protein [Paenibacillus sp. UNC496MF]SFJ02171.1 spore coat protein B [Paenibacillus sp. UNC496MF]
MNYWGNMGNMGNMGNEAISYKPYGMLGNQGMGMGNQGNHCCDHKDHKSHKSHHSGGNAFLANQVGMNVRINRGGPESLEGKLLGVQTGYLVLKATGGLVYVNTSHVKSVTDLPGSSKGSRGSQGSRGGSRPYIMAGSFVGVLRALRQKFVQINWGGPEKIEGFIADVGNNALLLVVGPELVQIPLYHIKTVKTAGIYASRGSQGSKGNNNNNNNNNKSGKNNNSSSGGNRNSSSGGANNRNASSRSNSKSKKSGRTSSLRSGSLRGK